MIKQMRASYFHNFKNAQYCALSDDPIPDDLENGDEVYIIDQGKIYYWDESSSSLYEYKGGGGGSGGSSSFVPCFGSLATVSLGTTWSGDDPYVSTVTVTGYTVTNQTMVSVLPSSDVVEQMLADGITNIFITNNDGVLTATVIGATPTVPMTLQVLCTESDISSDIAGLPSIVGSGIIQTVEADNLTDAVNILGEDVDDLKNAIRQIEDDVKDSAPIIINTASGNIASFADGADNRQIKKIVGTIVPVQSGTGDPSPDNVRPISGWTGANVYQAVKNLFDKDATPFASGKYISSVVTGQPYTLEANENYNVYLISVKAGVQYTFGQLYANQPCWAFVDKQGVVIHGEPNYGGSTGRSLTWTAPTGAYALLLSVAVSGTYKFDNTLQVEMNSSASDYEQYHGQTLPINWQTEAGTIYGGTVTLNEDGSCDIIPTHAEVDMGTLTWTSDSGTAGAFFNTQHNAIPITEGVVGVITDMKCERYKTVATQAINRIGAENYTILQRSTYANICVVDQRYTNAADFKASVSGVKLVYPLATPGNPIHFPNVGSLYTYLGTNNVWIDTGSISECDYPADTKLYIDGLTAPDEDMIANANIASGKYFVVNNQLYLSTAAIAAGASIVPGTNCTATNLAEALNALNT